MQRPLVEIAIRDVCAHRQYKLLAVQARTNHVHSVVSAACKPEQVMNAFKSYATRRLREYKLHPSEAKLWARHGSTKYLWTERHIEIAVEYVVSGQGEELPSIDLFI